MARIPLRRFFRHGFLPQLMAFEACVRLGSVTRAAQELSLAQPTVSCMLRKLSDAMDGPVTVMRERRVHASPIGRELLVLCHDIFAAMRRFEERRGPGGGSEGGGGVGYDPVADPPALSMPWLSASPRRNPSRWKQRALQCPPARTRRTAADGES